MEKRIPHYNLPVIKDMIKAQKVRATLSALTGGAALGLDVEGIIGVVMALTQRDFYKSMTTYVIIVFGKMYIGLRHRPETYILN